jgi:hypothetical protein
MIHEGNPDLIGPNNLINTEKMNMLAGVIGEVRGLSVLLFLLSSELTAPLDRGVQGFPVLVPAHSPFAAVASSLRPL